MQGMMKRSQRGAARVSAVWMIVVIVLFFVSLGFAYVGNQAAQQARENARSARTTATEADESYQEQLQKSRDVSVALGFYDRDVIGSLSDVDAAANGLTSLKAVIAMPESVTDFERAVQPIIDAFRAKDTEIGTLQGRVSSLEGQLDATRKANSEATATLQGQIDELRQKLGDCEQNAADEKARLENDVADARNQINQLDNELNTAKGRNDDLAAEMERAKTAATTYQSSLNRQLKILKEPPGPDGEILAVSKDLGIGWIDRGAKHRVSRGMIFEVTTGQPNPEVGGVKARAEVIDVQADRAEVRIYDVADPYSPVVAGDLIHNPLFDPYGERYAVLLGRFSGTYNEAEVEALLEDIGITVQENVDLTTNYLIVGGPLFYDEEGEPVEEPIQPSELSTYKEAVEKGVYIISINALKQYFRR